MKTGQLPDNSYLRCLVKGTMVPAMNAFLGIFATSDTLSVDSWYTCSVASTFVWVWWCTGPGTASPTYHKAPGKLLMKLKFVILILGCLWHLKINVIGGNNSTWK